MTAGDKVSFTNIFGKKEYWVVEEVLRLDGRNLVCVSKEYAIGKSDEKSLAYFEEEDLEIESSSKKE